MCVAGSCRRAKRTSLCGLESRVCASSPDSVDVHSLMMHRPELAVTEIGAPAAGLASTEFPEWRSQVMYRPEPIRYAAAAAARSSAYDSPDVLDADSPFIILSVFGKKRIVKVVSVDGCVYLRDVYANAVRSGVLLAGKTYKCFWLGKTKLLSAESPDWLDSHLLMMHRPEVMVAAAPGGRRSKSKGASRQSSRRRRRSGSRASTKRAARRRQSGRRR